MTNAKTKIIDGVEYTDEFGHWASYNIEGEHHSFNDRPAVISPCGTKYWCKNDNIHRDNDKPAIICPNGTKYWYKNGVFHRNNDKPAIMLSDGTKYWYEHGEYHRDNDKPAIIYPDGTKAWYENGKQQCSKNYICSYIRGEKYYKRFFVTELLAKQYESEMLAKNICAWVIENVG